MPAYKPKDYRVRLKDFRPHMLTILNLNPDKKLNLGEYRTWSQIRKKGDVTKAFSKFEDFYFHLGKRPEGAKLARRNPKRPHSPANSYWSVPTHQ